MTSTSLNLTMTRQLQASLDNGEAGLDRLAGHLAAHPAEPLSPEDRAGVLLLAYRLRAGRVEDQSRWADHPAVAGLRWSLERSWREELEAIPLPAAMPAPSPPALNVPADTAAGVLKSMRWLAARDRLPVAYTWAAKRADLAGIVSFLSAEGGPDAGFDDLVAACQVGLTGSAKMELARNYWDEMGNGDPSGVHTEEHARMAAALGIHDPGEAGQSVLGLERAALCGMLAANHWLQPELLGALGLIELQAGPRCRLVTQGLRRVGAPAAALPFYDIHADVDPRHGRDWLDNAIAPVVRERPDWGPRIVRGAWWRSLVNARFFEAYAAQNLLDDDCDERNLEAA